MRLMKEQVRKKEGEMGREKITGKTRKEQGVTAHTLKDYTCIRSYCVYIGGTCYLYSCFKLSWGPCLPLSLFIQSGESNFFSLQSAPFSSLPYVGAIFSSFFCCSFKYEKCHHLVLTSGNNERPL